MQSYPSPQSPESLGFENIIYEKRDGRATVTINRPQVLNALNFPTLREMTRAFEDASWDDAVGVLVLTGAGERAFCTGADLDEQEQFLVKPNDYWKWMGAFIESRRHTHAPCPSMAAIAPTTLPACRCCGTCCNRCTLPCKP